MFHSPWALQVGFSMLIGQVTSKYFLTLNSKRASTGGFLLFFLDFNILNVYLVWLQLRKVWLSCATACSCCHRTDGYIEAWNPEAFVTVCWWYLVRCSFKMWWIWCIWLGICLFLALHYCFNCEIIFKCKYWWLLFYLEVLVVVDSIAWKLHLYLSCLSCEDQFLMQMFIY